MEITKETIQSLYSVTHYSRNGLDLDTIFNQGSQNKDGAWGDRYNLVYYLLEQMAHNNPELGFSAICLHSDGGVQNYLITYKWGDYTILISNENNHGSVTNFDSVDDFCLWLNNHANFIKMNTREGGVLRH